MKQKLLGCKTWQQKSVGDNGCDGAEIFCHREFNRDREWSESFYYDDLNYNEFWSYLVLGWLRVFVR